MKNKMLLMKIDSLMITCLSYIERGEW